MLLLGSGSGGLLSGSGLSLGGCGLNSGGFLNNWLLSWGGLSLNLSSGGLSHWDEAVGPLGRCRGGLVVSGSGVIDWCVVNWGSVDWRSMKWRSMVNWPRCVVGEGVDR